MKMWKHSREFLPQELSDDEHLRAASTSLKVAAQISITDLGPQPPPPGQSRPLMSQRWPAGHQLMIAEL